MVIKNYLPQSHAYAADTQLYLSFNPDAASSQNDAVEAMEHCVQAKEVKGTEKASPIHTLFHR